MTDDQIRAVLRDELGRIAPEIDFDGLDPSADLREQADLDSMDFLNLLTAVHQRLGIDIPESEAGQLTTIAAAIAYISGRRQGP
ncbi:acyl carrier protein [Caulobacter sp. ErkDOM-YI]|uniref:acyl carrier protein n=1 Tax=unclassified Caulobacter TaxID=2648921 RepID=UPI003AF898ED